MYVDNTSKLAVVVNRHLSPARAMNAMGHAVAGLVAATQRTDAIEFLAYPCGDHWTSVIARPPLIVLRGDTSRQLARLHGEALAHGLPVNAFVHTMVGTSAAEQQAATQSAATGTLEWWAVALYGEASALQPWIRRFTLYA